MDILSRVLEYKIFRTIIFSVRVMYCTRIAHANFKTRRLALCRVLNLF